MSFETENNDNVVIGGANSGNDFSGGDGFNAGGGPDDIGSGATANGNGAAGGADGGACRICNEEGHFARECPQKPAGSSGCFNCGEDGHSKADCPNPRVLVGNCRVCDKEGHFAKDCPDKPPETCKNCQQEGHKIADCKEPRSVDRSKYDDKKPEDAWNALKAADESHDMDDVRDAIQVYVKAIPDTTWVQLEASFRQNNFSTHLIGYEKEITDTFTLMDLQGILDRKYHVGFYWSAKPQRGLMKEAWPKTPEENIQRLHDAGIPVDRGIPKCSNCSELGHIAKSCTQDRVERTDQVGVKCHNCDAEGHRVRDCKQPRKVAGGACRNCNQPGHKASECTEPRNAANVECKHCGETGHFVKDCPNREPEVCRNCGLEGHRSKDCESPMNLAIQVCRNCDAKGHFGKDCPKPRDYSRVKCQNCGEMGHTKVRCKAPVPEVSAGGFDSGGDDFNGGDAGDFSGGFDGGDGGFNVGPDAPVGGDDAFGGGGDGGAW